MASYNRIIMLGNLTRDPEFKQLSSGQGVCRFNLASSRSYKNKQSGAATQEVCFIDVDVWGAQADICKQYLQKGRQVLIEGRIKLDSWQDNDGNKRSKHSIVAERVTFLNAGQGAQEEAPEEEGLAPFDPEVIKNNPAMSSVMDQVEKAKRSSKTVKNSSSGEFNFKDEKPFEDDLPF